MVSLALKVLLFWTQACRNRQFQPQWRPLGSRVATANQLESSWILRGQRIKIKIWLPEAQHILNRKRLWQRKPIVWTWKEQIRELNHPCRLRQWWSKSVCWNKRRQTQRENWWRWPDMHWRWCMQALERLLGWEVAQKRECWWKPMHNQWWCIWSPE